MMLMAGKGHDNDGDIDGLGSHSYFAMSYLHQWDFNKHMSQGQHLGAPPDVIDKVKPKTQR